MGRNSKLGCLEKRDLLNQAAISVDTLVSFGESFLQSDYVYDAADFYQKANAQEALRRILDVALDEGNVFLFKRICRVTGHEATPEEWLTVARRAEEGGKVAFATEAYAQAGGRMPIEQPESGSEAGS